MNNIFKNAYFGKPYKTRDGRKAIYWRVINNDFPGIALLCEDFVIDVLSNGIVDESCFGDTFPNKHDYDIVSEWKETINEEELDKLAFDNYCKECHYCGNANSKTIEEKYDACQNSECYRKTYVWKLINGFKAGYRKALKRI